MDISAALQTITAGRSLSAEDMGAVMRQIMHGDATNTQIGAFLIAMRMKGETSDEIYGAVGVMRELMAAIDYQHPHLVDTCGTGGDGANTFNISTASAFVVAAAGGKVAKHGNRAVSSASGSSDVLAAAGAAIALSPAQIQRCLDEVGFAFLFAPHHHLAMKHAVAPRKELAMRTLFNLIGPLTNPARAKRQLVGVYALDAATRVANALRHLGSERAMVVHAEDGLDEISLATPTHVAELNGGNIHTYVIEPEDFGIQRTSLNTITVSSPQDSLSLIRAALAGTHEQARDVVALNAGAALYVAGIADSHYAGVQLAKATISTGKAMAHFDRYVALTNAVAQ